MHRGLGDEKDREGGRGNSERGEVGRRRTQECRRSAFIWALIKPGSDLKFSWWKLQRPDFCGAPHTQPVL